MKNWVKLNFFYLGKSKKHQIFRVKRWNTSFEKLINQPVFNEKYEEIGRIKEIFGPVEMPFVSIKTQHSFESNNVDRLYAKIY